MDCGIEPDARDRLVASLATPDGGIRAVQATGFHDLDERRKITDWVEIGILLHVLVISVAVFDRLAEQAEGSL
jgi:hypothetical protein